MTHPVTPGKNQAGPKKSLFEILCQGPQDGILPDCFNMAMQQKILSEPEPIIKMTQVESELRHFGTAFNYFHRHFENENLVNCNAVLLSDKFRQWLSAPAKDKSPYPINNLAWLITKHLSPFDRIYDIRCQKGVQDLYREMAIRYAIAMSLPGDLVPPAAFEYLAQDYPCANPTGPCMPLSRGFAYIWHDYIGEIPFEPESAAARNQFFMRVTVFMQMTQLDERLFSPNLVAYLNAPLYPTQEKDVAVSGLVYEVFRLAGLADDARWKDAAYATEMLRKFFGTAYASLILPSAVIKHHQQMAEKLGYDVKPKITLQSGQNAKRKFIMEDAPALLVDESRAKVNVIETGDAVVSFDPVTRGLLRAAEASKLPTTYILPQFDPYLQYIKQSQLENKPWGSINLFHAPLEKLADVMLSWGLQNFNGRYNIGYCGWGTSLLPKMHRLSVELLDEIWVPSESQRELFAAATDKPVLVMPMPVTVTAPARNIGRAYFGLPQDAYVFLTAVEAHDWLARKNILGTIEAFRNAFPDRQDVRLVIKTRYIDRGFNVMETGQILNIQQAAVDDPRIQVYHDELDDAHMASLITLADCYVSLHRQSTLGRTVMEAMLLEKPVMITRGSGCADYANDQNAYLVDATPCSIVYDSYFHLEHNPHHRWLDPDLAQAASVMQKVVADRQGAAQKARLGREAIQQRYSLEAAARRMRERLDILLKRDTGIAA